MHLSIGKRVRQQKFHGGLQQITEEVILTAFAQSRRTIWISQRSASSGLHSSLRENIPFSRSSMTSPPASLSQLCRPTLALPHQVHSGDGCRSLHASVQVVVQIHPRRIARLKVVVL